MVVGTVEAILKLRDEMTERLTKASASLKGVGETATNAGKAMLPISAGLTLVGGASIKMATDFNRSMANVASLMPGNTARVNELKRAVQDMAIATGKSTDDLSGGLYQVVSAFGDTSDTARILEVNARAAAAGVATTLDSINLTSAVTKGYGDTSAEAVEKVSDLALMTVRLGQTTFPELAASIGRVTPLTAELGVAQEELFGVMATFTGVTGGAAEVSTQLRGALQALMAPTDSAQALFEALGVSSGKALIEQRGLQGALRALTDAATQTGKPLQDFIGSIEGQVLALAAAGGQSDALRDKTEQMRSAVGTTTEAYREQTEGVNAAGHNLDVMRQRIEVLAQRIGDKLMPMLEKMTGWAESGLKWVENAIDWFAKLPQPVQDTAIAIGAIAAISAPVLLGIGSALNVIAAGMAAMGTASTASIGGVSRFFALLGSPVGLALAGVSTGFIIANNDMKNFMSGLEKGNRPIDATKRTIDDLSAEFRKLPPLVAGATVQMGAWFRQAADADVASKPTVTGLTNVGKAATQMKVQMTDMASSVRNAFEAMSEWGVKFPTKFAPVTSIVASVRQMFGVMDEWAARPLQMPKAFGVTDITSSVRQVFGVMDQWSVKVKELKSSTANLNEAWASLGDTIVGAIQGGGNVGRAVGASLGGALGKDVGAALSTAIGGSLGKAIGSFAGPLGTLAGGAIGGAIAGMFGKGEGRKLVEQFAQSMGGFDALRQKMNTLGPDADRLWTALTQGVGKNNPEQARAAIKAIEDAFASAAAKTRAMETELQSLQARMGELNATANPTWRDMKAAADEFGVSIAALGPAFQQQRLTERATEIWNAFDTMKRGGADVNEVLKGMGDEIGVFVEESLKFKTKIPENLRPLIEQLHRSGQLIGANGEAIENIAGLEFGEPVKSQWELVADEIGRLSEAIAALTKQLRGDVVAAVGDVTRAFSGIPSDFEFRINRVGGGDGDEGASRGFATGTLGQWYDFGSSTAVRLHGRQRIMTEAEGRGASGGSRTLVLKVGEREFGRIALRALAGAADEYGVGIG